MEDYKQYYYAIFNDLTDLIALLEEKHFNQNFIIQQDAESRFVEDYDSQRLKCEKQTYQQYLTLNNGIMGILIDDGEKYQKNPFCAELLLELHKILEEANQIEEIPQL